MENTVAEQKEALIQAVLLLNSRNGDNSVLLRKKQILYKKAEYHKDLVEEYKNQLSKINSNK